MEHSSNWTKQQEAYVVTLAMQVECGILPATTIVELFKKDIQTGTRIATYWANFNDMTRRALELVVYEANKQLLEQVFRLEAENYPSLEK